MTVKDTMDFIEKLRELTPQQVFHLADTLNNKGRNGWVEVTKTLFELKGAEKALELVYAAHTFDTDDLEEIVQDLSSIIEALKDTELYNEDTLQILARICIKRGSFNSLVEVLID